MAISWGVLRPKLSETLHQVCWQKCNATSGFYIDIKSAGAAVYVEEVMSTLCSER